MKKNNLRIAIIQESPVYLNLKQSLEKAGGLLSEAARKGADVVTFGETWLSGYPVWLDSLPNVALWDYEPAKAVFAKMYQNSVVVGSPETALLAKWAKQFGVSIIIGVNEVVSKTGGGGTIYNSLLTFNAQGELVNHHRKLMPTYTEKLLYGIGDGRGLQSVDLPFGKLGSLICWEHWMPLARQAMHQSGELVHIAVWPSVHEIHQLASRHYAFEGRCFVAAAGQIIRVKDLPKELELTEELKQNPDKMLCYGGSCVIAPNGQYLLEPQLHQEGVFVCEIEDLSLAYQERMTLDVGGHYNRADVFEFRVKS